MGDMTNHGAEEGTPGAAGGGASDWRAGVAVEYRDHAALQGYQDINGLVKDHIRAQGLMALRRPERADDYELKIDERFHANDALAKSFREKVHVLGLSKKQVSELTEWYSGAALQELADADPSGEMQMAETRWALEREYGRGLDSNIELAKRVLRTFGDDGAMGEVKGGLGNNPHLIRMLVRIGEMMADGDAGRFISPGEAGGQIKEIMAMSAYQDRRSPENRGLREKAARLYKIAYPDHDELVKGAETVKGAGASTGKSITPISADDAKRQIKEIVKSPAYQDRKHPENRLLRKKAEQLYRVAYPDEA